MTNEPAAAPAASKILKSDVYRSISQAQDTVAHAAQEAGRIIAQAKDEAERIKAEAREQGHAEASALTAEYLVRLSETVKGMEGQIGGLAESCLRRILADMPAQTLIASAAKKAIQETDLARGAKLIVAPPFVEQLRADLSQSVPSDILEVVGDPDCPPASSVLRSEFGDIELGIETQLRALLEGIARAAEEGSA